ncbi:MAG: peptidoglycan DD-metalloendopeptidase family protein, partial [Actinomycetales bacterium]
MIDKNTAASITQKIWGVTGEVESLAGERDLNFKISGDRISILKFYPNKAEIDYLNLQDRILIHLSKLNLVPKLLTSKEKSFTHEVESGLVRLLEWIDGTMWAEKGTHSTEEIIELGQVIAKIDSELGKLELSNADSNLLSREFIWNMLQADRALEWCSKISDEELRNLVTQTLTRFSGQVKTRLNDFSQQLIHNDANEWNIVISKSGPKLIDFGDVIIAPRIVGLAVAGAYVSLGAQDPSFEVSKLVRGYHSVSPLKVSEIEILHDLVKTRIAMSIANAALQISANPENSYLEISQNQTPDALKLLSATDDNHALFRYRNAIGLEANPRAKEIRKFLNLKSDISDVVAPPFKSAKKVWIDWSVDNPNLPRTTQAVAQILKDSGASVGIGRYCENREVYQGEAFAISNPNARTFHLGVDLWMHAGAPVYAPLDGVIEIFNENKTYLDYGPVVILRHHTDSGIPFWTLYGHLSRASLKNWQIGKEIKAGELVGWMGEEEENVGWPPHTHFQLLTDLCGMGIDVHGVAPKEEVSLWRGISLNPNLILRIPEGVDAHSRLSASAVIGERRSVISQNLSLNFKHPLHIVKGE